MTDRLHLVPQHLALSVAKRTICLLYHLALQWNLTHHCFKCVNTVNFNILEHHCVSFSNNKFVLLLKGSINVSFSHVLCVQCLHLHHVALNATIYRPEGGHLFLFFVFIYYSGTLSSIRFYPCWPFHVPFFILLALKLVVYVWPAQIHLYNHKSYSYSLCKKDNGYVLCLLWRTVSFFLQPQPSYNSLFVPASSGAISV